MKLQMPLSETVAHLGLIIKEHPHCVNCGLQFAPYKDAFRTNGKCGPCFQADALELK